MPAVAIANEFLRGIEGFRSLVRVEGRARAAVRGPDNSAEPYEFRRPPAAKTDGFLKEFEGFSAKNVTSLKEFDEFFMFWRPPDAKKTRNSSRNSKVFGPWCVWKGGPEP